MAMRAYEGGCHCGAVRFRVVADLEEETVLDCNCSVCTKKGFLHLIVAADDFELIAGDEALTEYRFGTEQAIHKFCSTCGMHPFYTPRSHPDGVDVNARCLDDVDFASLHISLFDGANWEQNVDSIR